MLLPVLGLDRRLLDKKDGKGQWAISLVKLDSGDVAEIFTDSKDCVEFDVGTPLALDWSLSTYDKKLGVRVKSIILAE